MTQSDEYVLGTHDLELARLGLQHELWRAPMLESWRLAELRPGMNVIDIGAGPGFATVDLATVVGPRGRVLAVERSERFVSALRAHCTAQGVHNVDARVTDLMDEGIPPPSAQDSGAGHDAAWCRWVAMFVPSVSTLVARIHAALLPGGRAIFHEYSDYRTYAALPQRQGIDDFVREATRSFQATGGEPNIAGSLLAQLKLQGFDLLHARPIARAARPADALWQWPAGFIRTYVPRLRALGQVDDAWCARVLADLEAAEWDPDSVLVTPTVMEIIARKR